MNKTGIKFITCLMLFTVSNSISSQTDQRDNSKTKEAPKTEGERIWSAKYQNQPDTGNLSPLEIVGLDILIPGYGMYKLKKHFWGIGYGGAKLLGFAFIYLSIANYQYWHPLEQSLVNERSLNSQETFTLPGRSERFSAKEIKGSYEKAILWIIMASTYQFLVYGLSAWHTYLEALTQLEREGPFYKIETFQEEKNKSTELKLKIGYQTILQ